MSFGRLFRVCRGYINWSSSGWTQFQCLMLLVGGGEGRVVERWMETWGF